MSIFKLPSFLRGKNPKPLIEVFAEPEEEQNHSSDLGRSGSAKEVGKPILAEEHRRCQQSRARSTRTRRQAEKPPQAQKSPKRE